MNNSMLNLKVSMIASIGIIFLTGCATIFSGSHEKIDIIGTPPTSTLMVLGGPVGPLLAKTKKYGDLTRSILDLASKHLSKEDRKMIDKIGVEYFISALIVESKMENYQKEHRRTLLSFILGFLHILKIRF